MEETSDSDPNIYQVALPPDMNLTSSAFKFVRMDPSKDLNATSGVWNWMPNDENNNLTLQSNYNKYIIDNGSYTNGTWDTSWYSPSGGGTGGGGNTGDVTTTLPDVPAGMQRIFYDATLSKLSYNGDWGTATIPVANGNAEGSDIWCHYWKDGENGTTEKMTKVASKTVGGNTYSDVYYADISTSADRVIFYSSSDGGWPGENSSSRTGNIVIPSDPVLLEMRIKG